MARRIKKFYKTVSIEAREGGHAILLDGREAKTPMRRALAVPVQALAEGIAEEWRGEGDSVDFDAMALTRLATTAIDLAPAERAAWAADIVKHLNADLLCYRAEEPVALVERQERVWAPYLAWAKAALGADLRVTVGVGHVTQDDAAASGARRRFTAMDDWALIGAKTATEIAGSAVLGLALEARAFPAAEIFAASRLDERFQAERWGIDEEAAAREARLESAFMSVDRWFELLGRRELTAR
jgi:chaperone required for assembly of F1-ATPase